MASTKRRLWLTQRRLELGMTQTELARKCNITVGTISNIELGKRNPSGELAKRIAIELNIDMIRFFEEEKEQSLA